MIKITPLALAILLLAPLNVLRAEPVADKPVPTASAVIHPALLPLPAKIEWHDGLLPADKASPDAVRFVHVDGLPQEGYEIEIAPTGVSVRSSSDAGSFYAQQTLKQLRAADGSLPCVSIHDEPRFAWRGLMLDSSRHFQTPDEIKRWLDLLAMHKLNVFHWHLVDDHGWRFESKKHPLLTQIGAWREQPPIGRYGGFYTQEEMRDVVAYAAKLHITVVPEIEMPGHSRAALASYPSLACGGIKTEVDHFFDFPMRATTFPPIPGNNVLCAGKEETYRLVEDVLTEVMDIFPSTCIHCGGDEVPMSAWNGCKDCQAAMKANHLAGGHKLQAHFMGRIEKFLIAHGRKMIGWDEIMEGGLSPTAAVMSWRGTSGGTNAAKTGHDAVMSPGKPLYFDHRQSASPQHPPGFGGGIETLQEVYNYDPIPKALSPQEAKHILGAQANLWSCATETQERLELFAFPRLCALAEVTWTTPAPRDFALFQQRLAGHLRRLDALGVNYWKDTGHFQLGTWSPNPALKGGTSFEVPIEQPLASGKWTVAFNYHKGADALMIETVELLANNAVVASDVHEGTAGAQHIDNHYTLVVPDLKAGTTLVLRTKAHVMPWSRGGNGDTTGAIFMSQVPSIRLFAPEQPLPATPATTPTSRNEAWWTTRHQLAIDRNKSVQPDAVILGDSITHCWGGQPQSVYEPRGPEAWTTAFGIRPVSNLGFSGDRTQHLLWRIQHGELDGIAPKQVILLIGINNLANGDSVADTANGIDAACRLIHDKLPDAKLLVLGLLPCRQFDRPVDQVNHLLQTRLHPRPYIDVLDLGNKFRNADGTLNETLFSDGLHPNADGYALLGKAVSAWSAKPEVR